MGDTHRQNTLEMSQAKQLVPTTRIIIRNKSIMKKLIQSICKFFNTPSPKGYKFSLEEGYYNEYGYYRSSSYN